MSTPKKENQFRPQEESSEVKKEVIERIAEDVIETKKTSQRLKCLLTDVELLKAGRDLADAQNELNGLEAELKELQQQIKGKIARSEAQIGEISSMIRSGYTFRMVECEQVKNYSQGTITVFRKDTFEMVETLQMSQEDRQSKLPIELQ